LRGRRSWQSYKLLTTLQFSHQLRTQSLTYQLVNPKGCIEVIDFLVKPVDLPLVEPLSRGNNRVNLFFAAPLLATQPGALRQDSPTEVVAAGVPEEKVLAVTVAVAAEPRDRFQVIGLTAPPDHTLSVIRAVSV